jgi:HSP20 family protein
MGVLMAFNLPRIRNKSELQPNANKQSYVDDIFNNFFNEIASFSYPVSHGDRMLSPRTDITENETEYHLEVELPGVTQDNIYNSLKNWTKE